MKRPLLFAIWLSALLVANGCAMRQLGSDLQNAFKGDGYLERQEYREGLQAFAEEMRSDPNNPQNLYYYGRFLLASGRAQEARGYLEKAAAAGTKSDYHFWLGVACGELGLRDREREAYQQALQQDGDNVQAITYLANSLLQSELLVESLGLYQKALKLWPENPQALYNRAIILHRLQRQPEELLAWKLYLDHHPAGSFARLAADRLNLLGDHSYRNHTLGARSLTLTAMAFAPFSGELLPASHPSLDLLGATAVNMGKGTLQIIVYQQKNRALAKARALAIKAYLQHRFPELAAPGRLAASWFDVPEERVLLSQEVRSGESVQFFLALGEAPKKSGMKPLSPPPTTKKTKKK